MRIKADSECSQKRHEQHVFILSVQLSGLPSGFASRWLHADASATSFSHVVMWNCGGLLCSASFCQEGALQLKCDAFVLKPQLSSAADQPVGLPLERIDTSRFTRSKKPDGTCSGFSLFGGPSLICPHFQHLRLDQNCGNVAPKADSLKEFEYYVIDLHSGGSLESFIELIRGDLRPLVYPDC